MVRSILPAFGISAEDVKFEPFGSGLINTTWRIYNGDSEYILQKINQAVFKEPRFIAENVRKIADYLHEHYPDYLFVTPIKTISNKELAFLEGEGYFRLVPFVKGAHTQNVVSQADVAFEAARQFGKFAALLSGMDARILHNTIPNFHNLKLRYEQFTESLVNGDQTRIQAAKTAVQYILDQEQIVREYDAIGKNPSFKIRVMHHDTKINNVLLDENNKGMCVIDLDTVMPGYYISDAGDMLRTYLSPASEEETDLSKNEIREDIFAAIVKGYLQEMKQVLTPAEKAAFVYAGKFMIYMQAIRFLADHFNNDIYYGAKYPGHNYNRAINQIDLLQKLFDKEEKLLQILNQYIS
ncbi:phosphotransferase enzyme family protein [Flavihumibacter profundi]|uniref:phosphotransferase enzyme family protein n=1 Tax=Flavihumibacter profundi TaxID=2716883 RepID=UPI001CC7869E|nr:aminoglycoside phosphotransferase family protein [Flavihumibacter profundi]MBZ5856750.1 aminoglycoside phosphotransferase family protein [Flavihumibacter profundi]